MRTIGSLILLLALGAQDAARAIDVSSIEVSTPVLVCELDATLVKGATLPAWSGDGTRLAFLHKAAGRKFRLMAVSVGRATV